MQLLLLVYVLLTVGNCAIACLVEMWLYKLLSGYSDVFITFWSCPPGLFHTSCLSDFSASLHLCRQVAVESSRLHRVSLFGVNIGHSQLSHFSMSAWPGHKIHEDKKVFPAKGSLPWIWNEITHFLVYWVSHVLYSFITTSAAGVGREP